MFVAPPHLQLLAGLVQPRLLLPKHPDYYLEQRERHAFVHRIAPPKLDDAPYAYLWRWLKAYPRWLPLVFKLLRLIAETSQKPLAFFVASRLIRVFLPLTLSWAEAHHLSLVDAACTSKGEYPSGLARLTLLRLFLPIAQQYVRDLSAENEGVLSSQVFHTLRQRFIKVRMNLDIGTSTDPDFIELESRALNFRPYTLISGAVDLVVNLIEIVGKLRLLQILQRSEKLSSPRILGFALASSLVEYLNFLTRKPSKWTAVRHFPADARSMEADYLSQQLKNKAKAPDIKMLGLDHYVQHILSVARSQQGDMSASYVVFGDWKKQAFYIHSEAWRVLSLYWYALRAGGMSESRSSLAQIQTTLDVTSGLGLACDRFFTSWQTLRNRCNNIRALETVLNTVSKIPDPTEVVEYSPMTSPLGSGMDIELKDVNFRYSNGEKHVLRGVTTHIPAGSMVCIVGGNGAGKSTLLKLLTRLTEPSSGKILINKKEISAYRQADLHKSMVCQCQSVAQYHVTIAEFVWLGVAALKPKEGIDAKAVKKALATAGVLDVVEKLDKGIWSRLGPFPARATPQSELDRRVREDNALTDEWLPEEEEEKLKEVVPETPTIASGKRVTSKGCTFSGGEWAKICFARSLMRDNADLRIYDEPAAPADPITAQAIFERIESMRGKQTVILITHHIRAAMKADLVLCLKDGELVEQGTHEDLLKLKDGCYRSLVAAEMPEVLELMDAGLIGGPTGEALDDSGIFIEK